MKTVNIRKLTIGDGIVKICVPVVGKTKEEIHEAVCQTAGCDVQPDMVEFRADWYEGVDDEQEVCDILAMMRDALGEMPLLFTFRTAMEGGEHMFEYAQYESLLYHVASSGYVDAVDVEAFSYTGLDGNPAKIGQLVDGLHTTGCVVIGSSHDFDATPSVPEMTLRLRRMQKMGMDIAKIAVMPHQPQDVLDLLAATVQVTQDENMCPVITMSMSGQGVISRMCGEIFGSAVTFASVGRASAPGQVEVEKLGKILRLIHDRR